MSDLMISRLDLVKIKNALDVGSTALGDQIKLQRIGSAYSSLHVKGFVLSGKGWTLHFHIVAGNNEDHGVAGLRLYGNRERFEEDFILAKLAFC